MQLSTIADLEYTPRFSTRALDTKTSAADPEAWQQRAQFRSDVLSGLRSDPRQLSSVYFYDDHGSALFDEITRLPEYYLTRVEQHILKTNADNILDLIGNGPVCVVDLGAGSGEKTRCLLDRLCERNIDASYAPIDVSRAALFSAEQCMRLRLPDLQVDAIQADYVMGLTRVRATQVGRRLLVLWLGSSIGNLRDADAAAMLCNLASACDPRDVILIGFDLVKDPRALIAAYSDSRGVTAEFNYNLLRRINRELDGTFDTQAFLHHALYAPRSARMESYLISRKRQTVMVADQTFVLNAWEPIRTEISCKYTPTRISRLLHAAGLEGILTLSDTCEQFADVACIRIPK